MNKTDDLVKPTGLRRYQEESLDGMLEEGVVGAAVSLWENIASVIYRRFDQFLAARDLNLNEENGPIVNSMWYMVHEKLHLYTFFELLLLVLVLILLLLPFY